MNNTFLGSLAKTLLEDYGDELHRQVLILPNERPAMFLRRELAALSSKPLLSPQILGIEKFVFFHTQLQKCSSTETLLRLYESFVATKVEGVDFNRFLSVGQTVLTDFYECDLYMADAQDLFRYLSDIRKIEQWTPDRPDGANYARVYLALYESLSKVYAHHREHLLADGLADPALAFRYLADHRKEILGAYLSQNPQTNLIFVGFNALTPAEHSVMRYVKRLERARFFWDADAFYVQDRNQEAGKFFREMDPEILPDKQKSSFPARMASRALDVQIVETGGNLQQVLYATEKISEWTASKCYQNEKVAVVLSDEALIADLIEVLPKDASINLTLGTSLHTLQAGTLLHALSRLHRSAKGSRWYHRDILRVLRHPFLGAYFSIYAKDVQAFVTQVKRDNLIYVPHHLLEEFFGDTKLRMLWKNGSAGEILGYLEEGFLALAESWDSLREPHENYEREQTYAVLHLLREAQEWVARFVPDIEIRLLTDMIWQLLQGTEVNFVGEPETGIQIMGVLETRLLHLDRFVLLSANEDILPKGKNQSSLIPNDVKKHFDLPQYTHQDAIFAYHFYHLFHGASEADLVYTESSSGMGNSGPSRFIYQVKWEWAKQANIEVKELLYHAKLKDHPVRDIEIPQDKTIRDILERRFSERGISPSALVSYLRDPLEFYSRYVLGVFEDDDEIEEDADARKVGNAVHDALEELYRPFVGGFPNEEQLKMIKKHVPASVRKHLGKYLKHNQLEQGYNILALTAAEEMAKNAVDFDLQNFTGRKIVALENNYTAQPNQHTDLKFPLSVQTAYGPVLLTGKIDRLEQWADGSMVYLDYKTGRTDKSLSWNNDFWDYPEEKRAKRFGQAIQLMSYAVLAHSVKSDFKLALLPLKNTHTSFLWLKNAAKVEEWTNIDREDFQKLIESLVREILEESVFFRRVE